MTEVEAWFGPEAFARLHPLLQRLHREGGVLEGPVSISFGRGIAGWVGRRLALRMGIPVADGNHSLRVAIRSADGVLHWDRCFDRRSEFRSRFEPVGRYPQGHWMERSGPVALRLGVRIVDGGWHWQQRGIRVGAIRLPAFLLPRSTASKEAVDGRYRFSVTLGLPLLGVVLTYGGTLALCDHPGLETAP